MGEGEGYLHSTSVQAICLRLWLVRKTFIENVLSFQRTFREIMFLQEFGDHPNIVKLHNVMKAENDKDIYLVFEFMGKQALYSSQTVFSHTLYTVSIILIDVFRYIYQFRN